MLVLGIDPGTATTGYGLVAAEGSRERLLEYGVITTPAHMEMAERLKIIHHNINELIIQYSPQVMAIEQLFFHRNSKTVITVAQSRGVLLMSAALAGLEIAEYTPLQVKQAVVGYGNAEKKQIQYMVQRILKLPEIPKPDDAADAVALALCHLQSRRINSCLKGRS